MDVDVERLIAGWFEGARDKQLTHDECGTRLHRWHYRFGIPIIILTTGMAAAVFYSLGRPDLSDPIKMTIGTASAAASFLACLQTFLGLAQRADQHRLARDRYGALRRSLEILRTFSPSDQIELRRSITDIQRQMDRLAETSPAVPARWKKKIEQEVEIRSREHIFQLPVAQRRAPAAVAHDEEDTSDEKIEVDAA
jgi:hypothetical protein